MRVAQTLLYLKNRGIRPYTMLKPGMSDSTIAPPPRKKKAIFFNRTFQGYSTQQGRDALLGQKNVSIHFPVLFCKGISIDDVGVSRDTVFQEVRPGARFETGDFVKEMFGRLP